MTHNEIQTASYHYHIPELGIFTIRSSQSVIVSKKEVKYLQTVIVGSINGADVYIATEESTKEFKKSDFEFHLDKASATVLNDLVLKKMNFYKK